MLKWLRDKVLERWMAAQGSLEERIQKPVYVPGCHSNNRGALRAGSDTPAGTIQGDYGRIGFKNQLPQKLVGKRVSSWPLPNANLAQLSHFSSEALFTSRNKLLSVLRGVSPMERERFSTALAVLPLVARG